MNEHHIYCEGPPKEVFTQKTPMDVCRVRSTIITDEDGEEHFVVLGPLEE